MTLRFIALFIPLLMLVLSGCSTPPKSRLEALATLVRLREAGALNWSFNEYRSAEEAFARAEELLKKKDGRTAEQFYQLAMVKGRLLESRMAEAEELLSLYSMDQPPLPPAKEPAPAAEKENRPRPVDRLPNKPSVADKTVPVETARPVEVRPAQVAEEKTACIPEMSVPVPAVKENDDTEAVPAEPEAKAPVVKSDRIIGGEESYVVKKGDTLKLIGARLGVSWRYLAKINDIDPKKPLSAGQELRVVNRRIVPKKIYDGLVINIPDRTMYYFKHGRLSKAIPVALGKPKPRDSKDDVVWHTPTGNFKVLAKEKDPVWRVPPSIQKEMEEQGKDVVSKVPPGGKNPLGKYALRTSIPGIMIHSTIIPSSIYGFSSHGCVRVSPDLMEELYREVKVNTKGEIIYRPIKMAVTEDGRVFLEVHRDVYEKNINIEKEVRDIIRKNRAADRVDWEKVDLVLKGKWGIAEDVTL